MLNVFGVRVEHFLILIYIKQKYVERHLARKRVKAFIEIDKCKQKHLSHFPQRFFMIKCGLSMAFCQPLFTGTGILLKFSLVECWRLIRRARNIISMLYINTFMVRCALKETRKNRYSRKKVQVLRLIWTFANDGVAYIGYLKWQLISVAPTSQSSSKLSISFNFHSILKRFGNNRFFTRIKKWMKYSKNKKALENNRKIDVTFIDQRQRRTNNGENAMFVFRRSLHNGLQHLWKFLWSFCDTNLPKKKKNVKKRCQ